MDLNSLKNTVSNLTLYDIKAGVRKMQNGTLASRCRDAVNPSIRLADLMGVAVMNYTEMEAKVGFP